MATFRRALTPGATWFFTVVTQDRWPILTQPALLYALRLAFREVRQAHPYTLDAVVLLPDHLHCVWTLPEGDADYARRWNILKRLVSQRAREHLPGPANASQAKRGELGLWQRRFWEHQIRDDADLARHLDYLHWNPVKHGHVTRVIDWPWSSFHRYVAQGIYPADWGGEVTETPSGEYGEP